MKLYPGEKKTRTILLFVFIFLFLASAAFNAYFSVAYHKMSSVEFQNLDNILLSAKYTPSQNGKGVIIATDLAHDKSELTSLVYELTQLGYGVYIFDFPSQGDSQGNVTFHHNSDTYLAEQFYSALVSYSQLADMSVEDIHVIGYGSGARAILQTAALGYLDPASITLIGTDINLTDRIQYNVLNFTVDSSLSWVESITEDTVDCPVQIIASSWDNISTIADNTALADLLGTDNVVTLSGIPHYMLMNSVSVVEQTVEGILAADGSTETLSSLVWLHLRIVSLILAFAFLMGILYFVSILLEYRMEQQELQKRAFPEHFIRNKLLAWIPALVVMALIPLALYFLPINYPYNDIFRLSLFVSFGIVMFTLYKFTTFGDNAGQDFFADFGLKNTKGGLIAGLSFAAVVIALSFSGMTDLLTYRSKWLWIAIFTILCMFPFYVDEKERRIFDTTRKERVLLFAINNLGLLIAPFIFLIVGMYNTAFMCLLMIATLLFVMSIEPVLQKLNSTFRINALVKAFLFQLIVFAQVTMFLN
jgi:hypothetical protein